MSRESQLQAKRIFDVCVSAAGLFVLSPALLLIAAFIKLDSDGPAFFTQERVGQLGQRFMVLKFRTMIRNAEQFGSGLYVSSDDGRITHVGRLLRRFSLDELPQLWNVLMGEMSLIGPRPALPYQAAQYSVRQARRLAMRPGITGWSQVNGRNSLSWPERLEKDLWYVDHFSLWLDARILFRTVKVWLTGKGLYAPRENFFLSGHDDIPNSPRRAA